MPMRALMYEKLSVGLGWLSCIGGAVTAGFYSAMDAARPPMAALDPNSISTTVVIGTNAVAAVSGALLLAYGAWRKKKRDEKVADDAAFAASWEGKFAELDAKYKLLEKELVVTKEERDFVRYQLASIQAQNAKQTKKINQVAQNVKAVGDALHAPMSDDGEGTDFSMPTIPDEPQTEPPADG